ncbi:MAG: HupE/UreJ family protein [Gammaproteobacteria bacterium]|nr:HupE/UreJ family protein [Gammaproteobacteria bacterium]MDH4316154.1 HupE/UreJ family protein [Gammaproteobacteria bacterium]MDH5215352.1 HupE/UreJ family protein [Gammaproteobacteria bacterium]
MRIVITVWLTLIAVLVPVAEARAHALEPGYLEMRSTGAEQYAVLWKIPAVADRPMAIAAVLPASCEPRTPGQLRWTGAAYLSRWTATCPGGLDGQSLRIDGLERTATDVLARIDDGEGGVETLRLTPSEPEAALVGHRSLAQVADTYFRLGVEHILGGIDHLLFVAALLLLVSGWRRLVGTITAFTVAHSITLAAATLGVIAVPVAPIEALIALSIAFVAAEVVHLRQGRRSLTSQWPWVIAFAFGLLHGVGFASALGEIGLPQNSVPAALLFFNLGVEAGQLLFVAIALWAAALMRQLPRRFELQPAGFIPALPPYVIGSLGAFWVLQRIAAF